MSYNRLELEGEGGKGEGIEKGMRKSRGQKGRTAKGHAENWINNLVFQLPHFVQKKSVKFK